MPDMESNSEENITAPASLRCFVANKLFKILLINVIAAFRDFFKAIPIIFNKVFKFKVAMYKSY